MQWQAEFGPSGGLTRPKIGFKSGSFGFIKYIIGLLVWTLFEANPTWLDPFFDPEGQPRPDSTWIWGPKWGSTPQKWVGFGCTISNPRILKSSWVKTLY